MKWNNTHWSCLSLAAATGGRTGGQNLLSVASVSTRPLTLTPLCVPPPNKLGVSGSRGGRWEGSSQRLLHLLVFLRGLGLHLQGDHPLPSHWTGGSSSSAGPPPSRRCLCPDPCPWRPSAGCFQPGRRRSCPLTTCCSLRWPGRSPTKVRPWGLEITCCAARHDHADR